MSNSRPIKRDESNNTNKFNESFGRHRINLLRLLTTAFDNGMLINLELIP